MKMPNQQHEPNCVGCGSNRMAPPVRRSLTLALLGLLLIGIGIALPGRALADTLITPIATCNQTTHSPDDPIDNAPSREDLFATFPAEFAGMPWEGTLVTGATGSTTLDDQARGILGFPLFEYGNADVESMDVGGASVDPAAFNPVTVDDNEARCNLDNLAVAPPETTSPPESTEPETTEAPSTPEETAPPSSEAASDDGDDGTSLGPILILVGVLVLLVGGGIYAGWFWGTKGKKACKAGTCKNYKMTKIEFAVHGEDKDAYEQAKKNLKGVGIIGKIATAIAIANPGVGLPAAAGRAALVPDVIKSATDVVDKLNENHKLVSGVDMYVTITRTCCVKAWWSGTYWKDCDPVVVVVGPPSGTYGKSAMGGGTAWDSTMLNKGSMPTLLPGIITDAIGQVVKMGAC